MQAEDLTDAGKSQYTLLNPTPPQLMRDWYTDHAGVSPYTIDAGHYEADITAVSYGYHHRNPANGLLTVEAWSIGTTVIKAGLLNNLDAEVTIRPYERVRTSSIEHTFVPAPPPIIIVPGTIHFH
ncbi:MAG TPA: hypothetical protein VFC07_15410, partial [Verrucomicrobiae bacterium]|nr:hypothetical protein [Verrucomicrobiae bacterium]